jgi:hypothetical protein
VIELRNIDIAESLKERFVIDVLAVDIMPE